MVFICIRNLFYVMMLILKVYLDDLEVIQININCFSKNNKSILDYQMINYSYFMFILGVLKFMI